MKPIKPTKMPKRLETWLREAADWNGPPLAFVPRHARAILAALEYERQRATAAEQEAKHWRSVAEALPSIPPDAVKAMRAAGEQAAKETK